MKEVWRNEVYDPEIIHVLFVFANRPKVCLPAEMVRLAFLYAIQ
jgi:hypothetical protein